VPAPLLPMLTHRIKHMSGVKFTMLKEEHFEVRKAFLGTDDFDRLVVGHSFDFRGQSECIIKLGRRHRVYWLTISEVALDLYRLYEDADRAAKLSLRNMLTGGAFHLLVGFCGFRPRWESVPGEASHRRRRGARGIGRFGGHPRLSGHRWGPLVPPRRFGHRRVRAELGKRLDVGEDSEDSGGVGPGRIDPRLH